jgi:biotin operon repressor
MTPQQQQQRESRVVWFEIPLTTAAQLARWLQISERTVYRDIRDLCLSGVPVEGEAGVGYRLSKGFDLPPIMFSLDEVEAMVTGARMVEAWGGPVLATHARSALSKIALALPPARREEIARSRLFAPGFHIKPPAWKPRARLFCSGESCASSMWIPRAARRCALSARWPSTSGAPPGPWPPGASRAMTFATSGWTA